MITLLNEECETQLGEIYVIKRRKQLHTKKKKKRRKGTASKNIKRKGPASRNQQAPSPNSLLCQGIFHDVGISP